MEEFIENIMKEFYPSSYEKIYKKSPLLQYLNLKSNAIHGNSKSRRSLGNIYAIYSILYFYLKDNYSNEKEKYQNFDGYEYTKLFNFFRKLYGGSKLQNHALNSRVNTEFKNKIVKEDENDLILINNGKYLLHIDYLYVDNNDISCLALMIIEKYIKLLEEKDNALINTLNSLFSLSNENMYLKKQKILELLTEDSEARIFEIISYVILKNYYSNTKIYWGYSLDKIYEEQLTLYKTGRTNANDGGIDFVMRPLGKFFQVTEVNSYDKYLLDIDKVMHFPITFVVKTNKSKKIILGELQEYVNKKTGGMQFLKKRYEKAIEEIITINEIKEALNSLNDTISINQIIQDIKLYYQLEFNIFDSE